MKVLQKFFVVHRMLIDFREKQATIVVGRFMGRSVGDGRGCCKMLLM